MGANGTSAPAGLRAMFYAILPSESQFQKVDQVPDYVDEGAAGLAEDLLMVIGTYYPKTRIYPPPGIYVFHRSWGAVDEKRKTEIEPINSVHILFGNERTDLIYDAKATLFFFLFIVLEHVYGLWTNKSPHNFRVNAGLSSVSAGLLMRTGHILMKNWEIHSYIWVHEHYRIVQLPWDSAWTWWACFLGVDLMYYWFHRMAHEVNFMWAAHQAHHSSEDYNLATSLRQSVFQQCSSWLFYLPLALFIPSPMFVAHIQFNLLYQFWIHTEVIGKLGPLEWVLNTASHHRVHHGRNRYCIDKNYAGTLIIWDRIFGTFEPEGEQVVYGLTHTLETFDPLTVQACHYQYMWGLLRQSKSWSERFSILFKGPGWGPGKPRLGELADIPDVHAPVHKYHPHISRWAEVYMAVDFLVTVFCFQELFARRNVFSCSMVVAFTLYILLTLTAIGATLDDKSHAPYLHALSHVFFLVGQRFVGHPTTVDPLLNTMVVRILQSYALASSVFWIAMCLGALPSKNEEKSK